MDFVQLIAAAITVTALFSYLNHRWVRLPRAIGLMVMGLAVSTLLAVAGRWWPGLQATAEATLGVVDFNRLVLHGVLGILLFAGALQLNLDDLRRHSAVIGVLSTAGVLLSTAIVGGLTWQILGLIGIPLPLIDCLLFGALISPTDPVAVIALLRSLRIPKALEVELAGESLFNDGIGVVVFITLLRLAGNPGDGGATVSGVVLVFLREAVGGVAVGALLGAIAFLLIKTVDDYLVEILLSLALVLGGWALAEKVHVSGPMAIVAAGLLIGNHGRAFAMSAATRERLDLFWEVMDELVNAVLFVLIGLELLTIELSGQVMVSAFAAPAVALLARWISTALPLWLLGRFARVTTPKISLMTWAGVRGPLAIALAVSLYQRPGSPAPGETHVIVVMTYAVVIFSVVVQGLALRQFTHGGVAGS